MQQFLFFLNHLSEVKGMIIYLYVNVWNALDNLEVIIYSVVNRFFATCVIRERRRNQKLPKPGIEPGTFRSSV